MGPNIYVAGSRDDITRVRALMKMLLEAGCGITRDWTTVVEEVKPAFLTKDTHEKINAQLDLNGVDKADVVVLLDHEKARGAMFELGYAHATGKPIIVVEECSRGSVFFQLADHRCSINELLGIISYLTGERQTVN